MQGLQHQYLNAMGIQVWQLRAASSVAVQPADVVEEVSLLSQPEIETPSSSPQKDADSSALLEMQPSLPVEPPTEAPVSSEIPEFRLASLIISEDLMIVTEVSKSASDAFDPQALRLLTNILYAQGVKAAADPVTTFFNWPMLRSPNFDQSEEAARQGCRAFINGQQTRRQVKWVLLLGELVGRYTSSDVKGGTPGLGGDDCRFILTHSLASLFEAPALKAEMWRHLEPLRFSLEQDKE